MPMDLLSGIVLPKTLLIQRLQERMPGAIEELPEALQARLVTRGIETPNPIRASSLAHCPHPRVRSTAQRGRCHFHERDRGPPLSGERGAVPEQN